MNKLNRREFLRIGAAAGALFAARTLIGGQLPGDDSSHESSKRPPGDRKEKVVESIQDMFGYYVDPETGCIIIGSGKNGTKSIKTHADLFTLLTLPLSREVPLFDVNQIGTQVFVARSVYEQKKISGSSSTADASLILTTPSGEQITAQEFALQETAAQFYSRHAKLFNKGLEDSFKRLGFPKSPITFSDKPIIIVVPDHVLQRIDNDDLHGERPGMLIPGAAFVAWKHLSGYYQYFRRRLASAGGRRFTGDAGGPYGLAGRFTGTPEDTEELRRLLAAKQVIPAELARKISDSLLGHELSHYWAGLATHMSVYFFYPDHMLPPDTKHLKQDYSVEFAGEMLGDPRLPSDQVFLSRVEAGLTFLLWNDPEFLELLKKGETTPTFYSKRFDNKYIEQHCAKTFAFHLPQGYTLTKASVTKAITRENVSFEVPDFDFIQGFTQPLSVDTNVATFRLPAESFLGKETPENSRSKPPNGYLLELELIDPQGNLVTLKYFFTTYHLLDWTLKEQLPSPEELSAQPVSLSPGFLGNHDRKLDQRVCRIDLSGDL